MAAATQSTYRPYSDEAAEKVEREQLSEVTWTGPERGDETGNHTGFVRLERVDGARFTITFVASTANFEALKDEVLPTVKPGDCSS